MNILLQYNYLWHFLGALSFFVLGLFIFFQLHKTKGFQLAHCLVYLAIFALFHATLGWLEMFKILQPELHFSLTSALYIFGLIIFAYVFLLQFVLEILAINTRYYKYIYAIVMLYSITIILITAYAFVTIGNAARWTAAAEQYLRHFLVFPTSVLAAIGFILWGRKPEVIAIDSQVLNRAFIIAAALFFVEAMIAGFIPQFGSQLLVPLAPMFETLVVFGLILCVGMILRQFDLHNDKLDQLQNAENLFAHFCKVTNIVETKESYYDGHHHKVAAWSEAIAKEMQLAPDKIDIIKRAALLHDLGKIEVSHEILNRARPLLAQEFSLVKIHPKIGYDLIKSVEFPWPLAEIVLQHHEHIDGTGYPCGLTGDEMLLEAKVLVVAEVVATAFTSKLFKKPDSKKEVIAYLERFKNIYYDLAVVSACTALLKAGFEKKLQLL